MKYVLVLLGILAVGSACLGGGDDQYAKYEDKKGAIRKIDALLASFPEYPGARLVYRLDTTGSYHVAPDRFIEAAPFSTSATFSSPHSVAPILVQRFFLKAMRSRGWHCWTPKGLRLYPKRFGCTRGHAVVGAAIARDGHYEMSITAEPSRPPIRTIPGD